MHLHIISTPISVSIGFLLCAGTLVVWWHVVVVGWVRIGVHRGCGLVGFGNSPLTCGVNIQTHMSIMPCACLCLSMVGHGWLDGWVWVWLHRGCGLVGF